MAKNTPKKKHEDYVVDSTFRRTQTYRYLVSDLTEAEAKDLVCDLMDCVQKLIGGVKTLEGLVKETADTHNFVS